MLYCCCHLVTRLMRSTDSKQVVPTCLISGGIVDGIFIHACFRPRQEAVEKIQLSALWREWNLRAIPVQRSNQLSYRVHKSPQESTRVHKSQQVDDNNVVETCYELPVLALLE